MKVWEQLWIPGSRTARTLRALLLSTGTALAIAEEGFPRYLGVFMTALGGFIPAGEMNAKPPEA